MTLNPWQLATLLMMLSRFHTFEKASIAQHSTPTNVLPMQKNPEKVDAIFAILMERWKGCNSCLLVQLC